MKLQSSEDKLNFLSEVGRIDLIDQDPEDYTTDLFEEFIKRRKHVVPRLKNFRRAQIAKSDWRKYRWRYMKGIRKFARCLVGSTKISLLSGEEVPIRELVGRRSFYVYSYDFSTNSIVPGRASQCRKTGEQELVVEVILDNDEVVRCTANHPFLLRSGRYKEAGTLKPGDSLMPLYREFKALYETNKYEHLLQPYGEWIPTHRVVYRWKYGKDLRKRPVTHHKNFRASNNIPGNLLAMTWPGHKAYHYTSVKGNLKRKQRAKEVSDRLVSEGKHNLQLLAKRGLHPIRNAALKRYGFSSHEQSVAIIQWMHKEFGWGGGTIAECLGCSDWGFVRTRMSDNQFFVKDDIAKKRMSKYHPMSAEGKRSASQKMKELVRSGKHIFQNPDLRARSKARSEQSIINRILKKTGISTYKLLVLRINALRSRGMRVAAIVKILGCSDTFIKRRIRKGLRDIYVDPTNTVRRDNTAKCYGFKSDADARKVLKQLYLDRRMTRDEIVELVGCPPDFVGSRLKGVCSTEERTRRIVQTRKERKAKKLGFESDKDAVEKIKAMVQGGRTRQSISEELGCPQYYVYAKNREGEAFINHKVKSVRFAGYEDVYDLVVDKHHNFALSAGVFVHNSIKGKRLHRSMGRFLATRYFLSPPKEKKGKSEALVLSRDLALKAISSMRTHMYIEQGYYMPLSEQVEFEMFTDYALPILQAIESELYEDIGYKFNEDEFELLLRLVDVGEVHKLIAEVLDIEVKEVESIWAQHEGEEESTYFLTEKFEHMKQELLGVENGKK